MGKSGSMRTLTQRHQLEKDIPIIRTLPPPLLRISTSRLSRLKNILLTNWEKFYYHKKRRVGKKRKSE